MSENLTLFTCRATVPFWLTAPLWHTLFQWLTPAGTEIWQKSVKIRVELEVARAICCN